MKIAITGYNGFIGKNLSRFLTTKQNEIVFFERKWLYQSPKNIAKIIDGTDAIVNLAGAPINKRWNKKHKLAIFESRVNTTRNLVQAIYLCKQPPKHLISASAIGIYDEIHKHDEQSTFFAKTFLRNVCKEWENAALYAKNYKVKVSILRLGIVLGIDGGMIKKFCQFLNGAWEAPLVTGNNI